MSDYSELKRLAEAFPSDLDWDSNTEPFFNGPSGESLGGGSTGFYSVYGKPLRIEGEDYDYDGPTYVEACNADFAKFMVVARDGVLALIAENDRLRGDAETVTSARGDKLFTFMSKDPCRYTLCEVTYTKPVRALIVERDQLKAENEALRKDLAKWQKAAIDREHILLQVDENYLTALEQSLPHLSDGPLKEQVKSAIAAMKYRKVEAAP
jgi:hypothetical protein